MSAGFCKMLQRLCYSGADQETFLRFEAQIDEQNRQFINRLNYFATFQLIVVLLSTLFTSYVSELIPVYLMFLLLYFVEFILRFFLLRQHLPHVNVWIWYALSKYFLLSFFTSIFYNRGGTAFTFFIFLIALPLLFIRPTWQMLLYITVVCGCFATLVVLLKPPEIALADLYYLFVSYLCSICSTFWINSIRLRSIQNEQLLMVQRDTDSLTGLHNRLSFNTFIARTWNEADCLNLIMLDVDFFKAYNDHYGHLLGDDILRKLGSLFHTFAEKNDLFLARYGGEEFVAFYAGSTERTAQLADELQQAVRQLKLPHAMVPGKTITISIGYACQAQAHAPSSAELLNCADKALYAAKKAGRNCVVAWSPSMDNTI